MKRQRRKFSGEEKTAILRRHLLENVPVSALCEEVGLQPTQFYQWQNYRCTDNWPSQPEENP